MKKIYYLLLLVLLPMFGTAQNCISIVQGNTTYTTETISFAVKWNTCNGTNHLYKVWVFVDYCEVNVAGDPVGQWQRATVGTPVVTGGPAYTAGNAMGFWLTAANNGLTANVKLQIGTGSISRFKWCAFATDYPPVAAYTGASSYTLKGTIPFYITYKDELPTKVDTKSYTPDDGKEVMAITDATGCPAGCRIRNQTVSDGTCCGGLTAVGGYCRDLLADKATTYSSCGIEVKTADAGTSAWNPDNLCPKGWRWPKTTELCCLMPYLAPTWARNKPWWSGVSYDASNAYGLIPCESNHQWECETMNGTSPAALCIKYYGLNPYPSYYLVNKWVKGEIMAVRCVR